MKAEDRKSILKAEGHKPKESNALAKELNKAIDTLKQGPSRSTTVYLVIGLVILASFLLFRYFWRSSEAAASARWVKLDEVIFPEQLANMLKEGEMEGKEQGRLLLFKEVRIKLTNGIRDLGANPSLAYTNIDEGTKAYEKLIDGVTRLPLLHQEALWGAAKGNESLGNIDDAKKFYRTLVEVYPTTATGKDAKKQLDRLDSDQGKRDVAELLKTFAPPK